jgi:hypothetical protein
MKEKVLRVAGCELRYGFYSLSTNSNYGGRVILKF